MLAMFITAFAASKTCTLSSNQTGAAYTASLNCKDYTHYSGYNSTYSTKNMILNFQMQSVDFSWSTEVTRIVDEGQYVNCSPIDVSGIWTGINFRTKIYSQGYTGGVEGVGCVFDYLKKLVYS